MPENNKQMLHLTPQERFVIKCLLTIFFVGTAISVALTRDAISVQWMKGAHQAKSIFPININTASVGQLDKLPGIGLKTAQRIVDYRQAHGLFVSIEDLHKVKGITKTNYKKVERLVCI